MKHLSVLVLGLGVSSVFVGLATTPAFACDDPKGYCKCINDGGDANLCEDAYGCVNNKPNCEVKVPDKDDDDKDAQKVTVERFLAMISRLTAMDK